MAPRTVHRLRYALRLVATVFFLSSPCGGRALDLPSPPAPVPIPAPPASP